VIKNTQKMTKRMAKLYSHVVERKRFAMAQIAVNWFV